MKNKKLIKVIGIIVLIAGISCVATSFIEFFIKFGSFESPKLFFLGFIGMPLIFVGIVLSQGKFGTYSSYSNPYMKGTTNNYQSKPQEKIYEVNQSQEKTYTKPKKKKGPKAKCRFCGKINAAGAEYCEDCGTRLSIICPKCNSANDVTEKYCRNCGKRLF